MKIYINAKEKILIKTDKLPNKPALNNMATAKNIDDIHSKRGCKTPFINVLKKSNLV